MDRGLSIGIETIFFAIRKWNLCFLSTAYWSWWRPFCKVPRRHFISPPVGILTWLDKRPRLSRSRGRRPTKVLVKVTVRRIFKDKTDWRFDRQETSMDFAFGEGLDGHDKNIVMTDETIVVKSKQGPDLTSSKDDYKKSQSNK